MYSFLWNILKIVLFFILFLIISAVGLYLYARSEAGKAPSDGDLAKYTNLPYFKNGRFQAWMDLPYEPDKTVGKGWFGQPNSPNKPTKAFEMVKLNKSSFNTLKEDDCNFYWLGHSMAIFEIASKRILLDPVFGRASPLPFLMPRFQESPIARVDLPKIDFVLITHDHYDHLEAATMRYFAKKEPQPHFIVPLGLAVRLAGWGIKPENITELGWGDDFQLADGNLKITAEPALHYSQRLFKDRNRTLWASYVLEFIGNKKIFIAGDCGYSDHFQKIAQKYQHFDFALIEIDAGNPGWKNTHMLPEQSVQASIDLNARVMIPVHWGVYDLALHPWGESIDKTIQESKKNNVQLLIPKMGEKVSLENKIFKNTKWW